MINTVVSFIEIPPLSKEISCHKLGVNEWTDGRTTNDRAKTYSLHP